MKWINVKDKLPDAYKEVLIYAVCFFLVGHWSNVGWFETGGRSIRDVTHWMPLPDPPGGA